MWRSEDLNDCGLCNCATASKIRVKYNVYYSHLVVDTFWNVLHKFAVWLKSLSKYMVNGIVNW